jgi:hypothetical protein
MVVCRAVELARPYRHKPHTLLAYRPVSFPVVYSSFPGHFLGRHKLSFVRDGHPQMNERSRS